jgi:hypothetical protein
VPAGTFSAVGALIGDCAARQRRRACLKETNPMHGIIYLVGLIVVIMAILSFFGLR